MNISLVFSTQFNLSAPKDLRLNLTHYLIMKVNKKNKKKLQNIAINHPADIDYKDFKNFLKIYRGCTKERYSFLTIYTALPASNPLRFRKKLFQFYKNDSN